MYARLPFATARAPPNYKKWVCIDCMSDQFSHVPVSTKQRSLTVAVFPKSRQRAILLGALDVSDSAPPCDAMEHSGPGQRR